MTYLVCALLYRHVGWMLTMVAGVATLWMPCPSAGGKTCNYEVIRISDLEFGTIAAGTSIVVPHTKSGAAKFRVRRLSGPESVRLEFVLPRWNGVAGPRADLSFSNVSAAWADRDDLSGRTVFDPHETIHISMPPDGDLYVWIGGSITINNRAEALPDPITILLTAASDELD